ncbi:MAG: glycoside hydrolase family 88 protein [Victivallales bacterium]|nr:glycoside hydrolase family 88 protein [Victivallales bacterium]
MKNIKCRDIAEVALERHLDLHSLNNYQGLVTLQGSVQLADLCKDDLLRERSIDLLKPFYTGRIKEVGGIYNKMYQCGGNATAWLVKCGFAPDAMSSLREHADELIASHPRDKDGIFGKIGEPEKIWIDSVFAVCPFLTIIGQLSGNSIYYDEACHQMISMDAKLLDSLTGLYFQCLNFAGSGMLSGDHWSRGNGWAAMGLAEMAVELPANHSRRQTIKDIFQRHMNACIQFQDEQGLWHQDMTDPCSYTETSGTGLILYAIGRGLEAGILDETFRENLYNGLKGCLGYIAQDGSIFNACTGCLCPGDGSAQAYKSHPWGRNDKHSFGPVILAFTQAAKIGIDSIAV